MLSARAAPATGVFGSVEESAPKASSSSSDIRSGIGSDYRLNDPDGALSLGRSPGRAGCGGVVGADGGVDARRGCFGALVPGDGAEECGAGAGGEKDGAAAGEGGEFVDAEDPLAFQRRGGGTDAPVQARGGRLAVVIADDLGQVLQEVVLPDAAEVEEGVGGGEEFEHAFAAEDGDALGPGLEHGHDRDSAGSEVGVEVGEVSPPADVCGFVEDRDQRHAQPAAGGDVGEIGSSFECRCGERGDEGTCGAGTFFRERVERAGAGDEGVGVELRAGVVAWAGVDPVGDVRVFEAGGHLLGGGVDGAAELVGGLGHPEYRLGRKLVAAVSQQSDGFFLQRVGQPAEHVADGSVGGGGGQQQAGEEVLAGGVEERVGLRVGGAGAFGEVLREFRGADVVGDVGERVPPPVRRPRGRCLAGRTPTPGIRWHRRGRRGSRRARRVCSTS